MEIILYVIKRCLYFVDMTTFYILGQKFVKFFIGYLENLRYEKGILRLTDLYNGKFANLNYSGVVFDESFIIMS